MDDRRDESPAVLSHGWAASACQRHFKFQYGIGADHIQKTDPTLYAKVVSEVIPKSKRRNKSPNHWSHWTGFWQGPRPRVYGAEVEGPIYESWPPQRQVSLLGESPKASNAEAILRPIAARAWRRDVQDGELDTIVQLVQDRAKQLGDIEAFKEGNRRDFRDTILPVDQSGRR